MKMRFSLVVAAISMLLGGCFSSNSDSASGTAGQPPSNGTPPPAAFRAIYVVSGGILPYPNDLFFNGSTDGTLNLPVLATIPFAESMNTLDGYSTIAEFRESFSSVINPATLIGGLTVNVVEVIVDPATTATIGVKAVLIPGQDYILDTAPDIDAVGRILRITFPLPLNEKSGYLVLMTNGIQDPGGTSAAADTDYATLRDAALSGQMLPDPTMNGISQLIGAHLAIAAGIGMDPTTIIASASYQTQTATDFVENAVALAQPQTPLLGPAPAPPGCPFPVLTTACALPPSAMPSGNADIWVGTLDVPYYLDVPADQDLSQFPPALTHDPIITTSVWEGSPFTLDPNAAPTTHLSRYNPVPVAKSTVTIPVLMTVPNALSATYQAFGGPPPGGWSVVVWGHGITRNRTDMLAVAEAFSDAGAIVISIDHALHGVTAIDPTMDPTALFRLPGVAERTFDIDLLDNATLTAGPDGIADPSGIHCINFGNPISARGCFMQAAADMATVAEAAKNIDLNFDGQPDVNGKLHFVGMSYGSMTASLMIDAYGGFTSATFGVIGGEWSQLARYSGSFAPLVAGGLISLGLIPDTTLWNQYFRDAQMLIDAGDPINFGAGIAATIPIHGMLVQDDGTIPNFLTEKMITLMGLASVSTPGVNVVSRGVVRLSEGSHGSQIDPTASLAATVEMQTEQVVFAMGNPPAMIPGDGQVILISDPSVIQ